MTSYFVKKCKIFPAFPRPPPPPSGYFEFMEIYRGSGAGPAFWWKIEGPSRKSMELSQNPQSFIWYYNVIFFCSTGQLTSHPYTVAHISKQNHRKHYAMLSYMIWIFLMRWKKTLNFLTRWKTTRWIRRAEKRPYQLIHFVFKNFTSSRVFRLKQINHLSFIITQWTRLYIC